MTTPPGRSRVPAEARRVVPSPATRRVVPAPEARVVPAPEARRVVVAPDAFKETASAAAVAAAAADAVATLPGVVADPCPLSDGGEGFVDVLAPLGGRLRWAGVTGPLGDPVRARWRDTPSLAVLEAATACGLPLTGGAPGNRPLEATTSGVGELLAAAVRAGSPRALLGVGGTATTDGGLGAVDALDRAGVTGWVPGRLVVACDVTTAYLDAADVFGPQKGATPEEVVLLRHRLREAAERLRRRGGPDPAALVGGGAGGGLAGALGALGAELRPGAPLVAGVVDLPGRLAGAAAVVTGEGRLDATSTAGKVVGTVLDEAAARGLPVVVVAGSVDRVPAHPAIAGVVDLSARCGAERAWRDPGGCLAEVLPAAVAAVLAG